MPLIADTTFAVVDVETTGLSPAKHRITEVACVLVRDGEIVAEHSTLVNPGQYISQEITQLTGISNAMAFNAPDGDQAFPLVRSWIPDDAIFVAHNAKFDHNFLQESLLRHRSQGLQHPVLCTARLARRVLPPQKSWALHNLAAFLGIKIKDRHRALGDAHATARALIQMLELLQEEHDCEEVDDLLSIQHRSIGSFRELPRHIQRLAPVISGLPHRPGIYRMLDARGELLYIGKARNLRERVGSYFQHSATHTAKIQEMVSRVRSIEIEETGSELGALLRESRFIKEHQPTYNTAQKRYRRYAFLRLDTTDRFPNISSVNEIQPDGAEYFGPFRSRDAVESMMETINHAFNLRECSGQLSPDPKIVPCFYHQIERCGAPCAMLQNESEYAEEVERVRNFLSGAESGIISTLQQRMSEHAEELRFEEAAQLRNRIAELRRIFQRQERIAASVNSNNVVLILPAAEEGKREIFLVRFGRLAAQVVVGHRTPAVKLRGLIERHFYNGQRAPEHCRREEIDEIRIIAGYLHQYRESGRFIYVEPQDEIDAVVERVIEALAR